MGMKWFECTDDPTSLPNAQNDRLDEWVKPHMIIVGLHRVSRLGIVRIYHALVTALVEWWDPETHTFHIPIGKITIMLRDVVVLLGLRVDGWPVTGEPTTFNCRATCHELFGGTLEARSLDWTGLRLSPLRDNFLDGSSCQCSRDPKI